MFGLDNMILMDERSKPMDRDTTERHWARSLPIRLAIAVEVEAVLVVGDFVVSACRP